MKERKKEMEITYICSGCGEVESFNSGSCPLCGSRFQRKKEVENNELKEIMDKVSGIFDNAFMWADSEEDRNYVNQVEHELRAYLRQKGLI